MPDAASMRAAGYEPEDFEGEVFEVWPENWRALELFVMLETQWNVGFSGATGLNYLVALAVIDRMKLDQAEADFLFADLRVMERAALPEMK
jgi:hypothetical protein